LIRDTMMPGIVASHNSTQLQLDGFETAFDACPDPQEPATPKCGLSEAECKKAASQIGLRFHATITNAMYPKGCFTGNKLVGFNLHAIGRPHFQYEPLCANIALIQALAAPAAPPADNAAVPLLIQTQMTTTTTGVIKQKFASTFACRERQAAAAGDNQKCQRDLAPLVTTKNAACNALKHLETNPVPEDFCAPTEPYDQWLISAAGRIKDIKDKLTGIKEGCGNATQLADDKKKVCDATQKAFDGNKTSCDQQQAGAEAVVCSEVGPDVLRCSTYETCYNNAVSAYTNQNATIVAMHLNWTVQWRTLKRMECLLDIMAKGGTNADIDGCKAKLWDTTWLDLNYPAIPPQKECSQLAKQPTPCDGDFVSQYYGNNPEGAPAAPCMPCSGPTTPAPEVAGGVSGLDFNDFTAGNAYPSRICVWVSDYIRAIQMTYNKGGKTIKYGCTGGSEECGKRECIGGIFSDRIISATVHSSLHGEATRVDGLEVQTTKGVHYHVGVMGAEGSSSERKGSVRGLCAIAGKYTPSQGKSGIGVSGSLDALGFVWSTHEPAPPHPDFPVPLDQRELAMC